MRRIIYGITSALTNMMCSIVLSFNKNEISEKPCFVVLLKWRTGSFTEVVPPWQMDRLTVEHPRTLYIDQNFHSSLFLRQYK